MKRKVNEKILDKYISFIEKEILDEEIKEKLIELIKFYYYYGKLCIDRKDLYGTYVNTKDLNRANPAKEFLEIKVDDNFICNYSEWSNRKLVNIIQNFLKGGQSIIQKKEIVHYLTYNNRNEISEETVEKIYDYEKKLIYQCKKEEGNDFNTYLDNKEHIIYNTREDSFDENKLTIEKRWYLPNGSILKYNLNKKNFLDNAKLEEIYTVCEGPIDGHKYLFDELPKELFISFMTGKITIEELLKETYKGEVKGHSLELIFGKKNF